MLKSIWDDVKREFSYGNMVTRIILINIVVFLIVNIVNLVVFISNGADPTASRDFYEQFVRFFSMSSDWKYVLTHPWVIITSMFLHESFWHILWNMLFMYWFGRIVGDFIGNQRILPIYLLGGITGSAIYFITANLLPYGSMGSSYALGASGAVMAIVAASGAIAPDYIIRLLLIGDVKLKYIVGVLILLDVFGIANASNTGGHFAHLGGALFGFIFVRELRQGNDWSAGVNRVLDRLNNFFSNLFQGRNRGPRVVYRNPNWRKRTSGRGNASSDPNDLSYQEKLDTILDKIKKSGYESLTEEEKDFLFNASKKQ